MGFVLCISALLFSIIMCFYHNYSVLKERALTTTSAGTQTTFSKSHVTFTLDKMHWSDDGRTTYIPFQFESTRNLSIDANDYKITVVPAYGSIHYKPTGNMVLFGSTGRGAIIINAGKKVPNEVLSIYIENISKIKTSDMDNSSADISAVRGDKGFEEFFKKHDILKFTVSPGAKNIGKNQRISATLNDPIQLYTQLFGVYDVSSVEKKIKQDKDKIRLYTRTAEKLQGNLERSGYAITDKPKWLNDNWKPYDYVDPITGKYSNGQKVGDKINADDPDDMVYSNLPLKNNQDNITGSERSEVEKSLDESSMGSSDQKATEWWSALTAAWDSIREAKRDWMVDQNTELYNIKYTKLQQAKQMSVGSSSQFKVRGKVVIK